MDATDKLYRILDGTAEPQQSVQQYVEALYAAQRNRQLAVLDCSLTHGDCRCKEGDPLCFVDWGTLKTRKNLVKLLKKTPYPVMIVTPVTVRNPRLLQVRLFRMHRERATDGWRSLLGLNAWHMTSALLLIELVGSSEPSSPVKRQAAKTSRGCRCRKRARRRQPPKPRTDSLGGTNQRQADTGT